MTLNDLHSRALTAARERGVTFKSLFAECGINHSTFHRARRSERKTRRNTAQRLLFLVARLVRIGEPVCLIVNGKTITRDAASFSQN